MTPTLPESLRPQLIRVLNELVEAISSLHEQVTKRVKAQAEKEAKMNDSDEEDSEFEDDSDDADEEEPPKKTKAFN
jgi:uncharacterized protein Yka (UPF0111/DUF47 family)